MPSPYEQILFLNEKIRKLTNQNKNLRKKIKELKIELTTWKEAENSNKKKKKNP